ncbi:MAG: extracellular solute-binding protein, partial [Burkholderiaceae bacterium]
MKMLRRTLVASIAIAMGSLSVNASAQVTLNVISGGSQNMVDYVTDYLGPLFEKQNPGVKVSVVGTGPDDAGSQKMMEKLQAQKAAGLATWDTDVIVPNQQKTGEMVRDGLLLKYRDSIATGKYAVSQSAKKALGVDVDGYVMPMFESQTALAYNPALIKNPPASYDELRAFVAKNPKSFGYNGIKGGMSGVAFVVGWVYAYGGNADTVQQGPYDKKNVANWSKAFSELKDFNKNVVFTPGNAGTLDMLNRG